MRLYGQEARLWEVLRNQDDLIEEGRTLWRLLSEAYSKPIQKVLELGCGCGPLAAGFPESVDMLLTDLSPEMLAVSKRRNPNRRHLAADMRKLDIPEQFDVVIIHDAVMYLTTADERRDAFQSVWRHLKQDGLLLIRPDIVAEDFEESLICGGGQANDKTVALTEWRFDEDPNDGLFSVAFSIMERSTNGAVEGFHETHKMALLTDEQWRESVEVEGLKCIPCGFHDLHGPIVMAKRMD